MPLSKRRRLFTPKKHKSKVNSRDQDESQGMKLTYFHLANKIHFKKKTTVNVYYYYVNRK